MKKFLSVFLTAVMLISILSMPAIAVEQTEGEIETFYDPANSIDMISYVGCLNGEGDVDDREGSTGEVRKATKEADKILLETWPKKEGETYTLRENAAYAVMLNDVGSSGDYNETANFGITDENYMEKYIELELELNADALANKNNLLIAPGYQRDNTSGIMYALFHRLESKSIGTYLNSTDSIQTIKIPMSLWEGVTQTKQGEVWDENDSSWTYAPMPWDWCEASALRIGLDTANITDHNVKIDISIRKIKVGTQTEEGTQPEGETGTFYDPANSIDMISYVGSLNGYGDVDDREGSTGEVRKATKGADKILLETWPKKEGETYTLQENAGYAVMLNDVGSSGDYNETVNFGITDENYMGKYIELELELNADALANKNNILIAPGYQRDNTSSIMYALFHRLESKSIGTYLNSTDSIQTVKIPMSLWEGVTQTKQGEVWDENDNSWTYAPMPWDWSEASALRIGLDTANITNHNVKIDIGIRKIKVGTQTEVNVVGENVKNGTIGEAENMLSKQAVYDPANSIDMISYIGCLNGYGDVDDRGGSTGEVRKATKGADKILLETWPKKEGDTYTLQENAAYAVMLNDVGSNGDYNETANFGITDENYMEKYIVLEVELNADALANKNNILIAPGYQRDNTSGIMYALFHRLESKSIGTYLNSTDSIQTIKIPMSLWEGVTQTKQGEVWDENDSSWTYAPMPWDWSEASALRIGLDTANITDHNVKIEIGIRKIEIGTDTNVKCQVSYGMFDNNGQNISALKANDEISLHAVGNNETSSEKEMLIMMVIYKDGIMKEIKPAKAVLTAGTNRNLGLDIKYKVPSDTTGLCVKGFIWSNLETIQPYVDFIVLLPEQQ